MTATLGAICHNNGTTFRVWAPKPHQVEVLVRPARGKATRHLMSEEDSAGYRLVTLPRASAGTRYGFLLDGEGPFPDPCSRSQPDGVHGLSEVVDPATFEWDDGGWKRRRFDDLVIYECHIGTFTPEGTFDAAIEQLPALRDLGVTAIEVMPVAAFPGRWGWGYDGVALFAPFAGYGGPDGFRRFVAAAHRAGLAVILDVVFNHFGPDGNYTGLFSDSYLSPKHETPWGRAINFDGRGADHVRRFFRENLLHWLDEYHVDGFRLDATHAIIDDSQRHILAELSDAVRARGEKPAPYLIAESHENDVGYLRPTKDGGCGFDAVWADDFHHAVRTLLLSEREGYLQGYDGSLKTLAKTLSQGFFYEGQVDPGYGGKRGTKARGVPWGSFVYHIQNHDQIGNHPFGERLPVSAALAEVRVASTLLMLLPQTPMLYQGQEWFTTRPFLYFSDHNEELGKLVTAGRRKEFAGFKAFNDARTRELIPDPQAPETFERSVLDHLEARVGSGALAWAFHKAVIALRQRDPVLKAYRRERLPLETAVHGDALIVGFASPRGRRWIVANFGRARAVPVPGATNIVFNSNDGHYGGRGIAPALERGTLNVPPRTAVFLRD